MGGVSVALLFDGEREHPTRAGEVVRVWRLVVQERERPAAPRRSPSEREEAPAPPAVASNAPARPGGSERAYRPGSAAARRDRAERDAIERHGGEGALDGEPIPF
jgi:hypothetical protein